MCTGIQRLPLCATLKVRGSARAAFGVDNEAAPTPPPAPAATPPAPEPPAPEAVSAEELAEAVALKEEVHEETMAVADVEEEVAKEHKEVEMKEELQMEAPMQAGPRSVMQHILYTGVSAVGTYFWSALQHVPAWFDLCPFCSALYHEYIQIYS